MEVHFTPAKGRGNITTTTLAARSSNANHSAHANRSPHANQATAKPLNAPAANERSPIIHSHQYVNQPIAQPLTTLPANAHSNTIHSRRSPGSSRPHTPTPVQTVASTTDETSVDSVAIRVSRHPDALLVEQQQLEEVAVRAPRERRKKAPARRQVEFPPGLFTIHAGRHVAMGVGTSGTTIQQAIDVGDYEEQRRRRSASRLEQDDRMYEQFWQERARMIAELDARLLEVGGQAEEERARYAEQVRRREIEIQRLHRTLQQADRNALESQNGARLAAEELARAQAQTVGAIPRVATPLSQHAGSTRLPQNASPRRQANLRPPTNPDGDGLGYDRVEYLIRDELAALEWCTPPKHRRCGEETGSNADRLRNSPMIAAIPPRPGQGTRRGVPRERDSGGPQILAIGK